MLLVIASILNFVVVVGVLWHFGRKPLADFLVVRADRIEAEIVEAQSLATAAGRELAKWESNMRDAEAHSHEYFEQTRNHMAHVWESRLTAAREQAQRIREEVRIIAQNEFARARRLLLEEVVRKSLSTAKRFLEGHVGEQEQAGLVAAFVERKSNGQPS